jgi:hypothetical protein
MGSVSADARWLIFQKSYAAPGSKCAVAAAPIAGSGEAIRGEPTPHELHARSSPIGVVPRNVNPGGKKPNCGRAMTTPGFVLLTRRTK